MTDVYIVALSIIGFLITAPGLAVALNLLLPRATERAYMRLEQTPVVSFIVGFVVTGALVLTIVTLVQSELGAPAIGLGVIGLGVYGIGAAAMSRLLGERIGRITDSGSPIRDVMRGAVVLELACLVPLVGWFLFTPLTGMTTLGASILGLLGWAPRARSSAAAEGQNDVTLAASTHATNLEAG